MPLFAVYDGASGRAKRARTDEEGNDNQDDSEGGDDAETPAIKRRVMPVRKPAPQGRLLPVALKRTGCCFAYAIVPRLLLVLLLCQASMTTTIQRASSSFFSLPEGWMCMWLFLAHQDPPCPHRPPVACRPPLPEVGAGAGAVPVVVFPLGQAVLTCIAGTTASRMRAGMTMQMKMTVCLFALVSNCSQPLLCDRHASSLHVPPPCVSPAATYPFITYEKHCP